MRKAKLPTPRDLERICKGIATLDAILSEDWEARYYSFNAKWNPKRKERMASMRNGSGDEWFIVFAKTCTFVKSFWHEHAPGKVKAIYAGLPEELAPQLEEAAFSIQDVTFGGYHDGKTWTLRGDAAPMIDELAILSGDPARYLAYAAEYFEVDIPEDAVAHVLAAKQLDAKLITKLGGQRTLVEMKEDLAEIAYGR
jgi:hypothetical protein